MSSKILPIELLY